MGAVNNKTLSKCHASYHMRLQEYALWEVCMRLTSGGRNKLYFDGRAMAARFAHCSRSAIYNQRENLLRKGWLEPLNLGPNGKVPRKANGQCSATELCVLTHDQWIEKYGTDRCCQSSPLDKPIPAGWTGPVQKIDLASPESKQEPVQPSGHSFVKDSSVKESSVNNPLFELGSSNDECAILAPRNHKPPSQEACRLAAKLKAEICRNKPDFRVTPQQERKWAVTAQRMIAIDKRIPQEIADLIEWVQRDEFWMSNVLSMGKLREKFDQLELKRTTQDRNDGHKGTKNRHSGFEQKNYTAGLIPDGSGGYQL